MTELEKLQEAIARKRAALGWLASVFAEYEDLPEGAAHVSDDELLLSAASSWAALVWRKGTERPTTPGTYECHDDRYDDGPLLHLFWDGKLWHAVTAPGGSVDPPDWWRDLSALPPLPEATDEG